MRFVDRGAWAHNSILPREGETQFFTFDQLKTMTIDSMKAYLRRRIGGYTVAIKPMRTTNKLFRGIFCDERPSSVERISCPPPHLVLKPGRANRDHSSMFYGCVGAFPIFFEIHAKQGDLIALSEWAVTEPLWMRALDTQTSSLFPSFAKPYRSIRSK
jgi:hypothetical protein